MNKNMKVGVGMVKGIAKVAALCAVLLIGNQANAEEEEKLPESKQMIIINKFDNSLTFYKDGYFIREFDVATGRVSSFTPEGDYQVANKVKNMPYYKTNIPGGDPRNPLGDRWIGLNVPNTQGFTYGMHGTNMEWTIGTYASSGCVRMYNSEVRWLFKRVEIGARVIITNQDKSAEEIAKESGYSIHKGKKTDRLFYSLSKVFIYNKANGESYTVARPLTELKAVEKKGDWYRLESKNGKERWVKENYFYRDIPVVQWLDPKKSLM